MDTRIKLLTLIAFTFFVDCAHKPSPKRIEGELSNTSRLREVRGVSKLFCETSDSGYQLVIKKTSYDNLDNDEKLEIESKCAFKGVRVIVNDNYKSDGEKDKASYCSMWVETTDKKITGLEIFFPVSWQLDAGPTFKYGIKYENGIPKVDTLISNGWAN